MISLIEAKKIIEQHVQTLPIMYPSVSHPRGFFLADNVFSTVDVPPFDNAAMDGYAIAGIPDGLTYPVVAGLQAGDKPSFGLNPGEACRIFTGSAIPAGANLVCAQEWVERVGDRITINAKEFVIGQHIRHKGSQCKRGALLAPKGAAISPGLIGLLSSCGLENYPSYRSPKVSCIITGNELVEPGNPLPSGKIYNSNGPALHSYVLDCGAEIQQFFQVTDDLPSLNSALMKCVSDSDVVILTGGISAGDYDLVKQSLENLGVETLFHKVRQKPGKPFYTGIKENQWFFGLPGNPASVLSCFNQYVKPCLRGLMGDPDPFASPQQWPLSKEFKKKKGMSLILKAQLKNGKVHPLPGQESFNLMSFSVCNGFVLLHEEDEHIPEGTMLDWFPW